MALPMTVERQLKIISQAWGRQSGYAFFPWISGEARNREERIKSYHEGPAFLWPRDQDKIITHLEAHQNDDLYWCPMLFEKPRRQLEYAMDERCLWADLDAVDPRELDIQPTIAWETSPGHYQALWMIDRGDMLGASWQGGENQRLTYYLGADPSGWDTTQLLRVPGWKNWKYEYRGGHREGLPDGGALSAPKQGKLLWKSGRRYDVDEWDWLPTVESGESAVHDILEDQVEAVDTKAVWGRVRLRVTKSVRELMAARASDVDMSDRSAKLWEIERELADAGCTATEIVALVRETAWNKYAGRQDEFKRLVTEAGKAIAARSSETEQKIEREREEKPDLIQFAIGANAARSPVWLVRGIWTEGGVGFIAGQPKSHKSWLALDLGYSVAGGMPFLNHFTIEQAGPVMYLQEEDSWSILKRRKNKIWPNKMGDRFTIAEVEADSLEELPDEARFIKPVGHEGNGSSSRVKGKVLQWHPPAAADEKRIPLVAAVGVGFTISDDGWQAWLDEQLTKGYQGAEDGADYFPDGSRFKMVIMDPLMMMAGDTEDNKANEMVAKIFRPLKELARKHNVAICLVHHLRKTYSDAGGTDTSGRVRGGQLMLGSVANHAWSEDSLYIHHRKRDLLVEQESKSGLSSEFKITNISNRRWEPVVELVRDDREDEVKPAPQQRRKRGPRPESRGHRPVLEFLKIDGAATAGEIKTEMGITYQGAYQQLKRLETQGLVKKRQDKKWYAI